MKTERLKYVSNDTVDNLRSNIRANLDRYRSGDFNDLILEGNWSIELDLDVDLAPLMLLDESLSPTSEIANSKRVWSVLRRLKPSVAYEEGIWVRLTHIECLQYSRARWLREDASDDEAEKLVADHFFAETLTRRRDDNAVSRLWWNAFIADLTMPGTDLAVLDVVLRRADFRSNFIERSATSSRPALGAAIVRAMQRYPWVIDREENFRLFMRAVNKRGGGTVFEAMTGPELDEFTQECALFAGMPTAVVEASGTERISHEHTDDGSKPSLSAGPDCNRAA